MTEYIIKKLTPDLLEDYFDFFDNRAFSDGSPFYPCYCNANDRLNYYRVGEFDLSDVPQDEICDYCQNKGEIKSVVCFEISPEYRGKGIATLLLNRICNDAELDGYKYVEAYPMISEGVQGLAFTGPKRLYEKAGFDIVEQRENLLVMRKKIK